MYDSLSHLRSFRPFSLQRVDYDRKCIAIRAHGCGQYFGHSYDSLNIWPPSNHLCGDGLGQQGLELEEAAATTVTACMPLVVPRKMLPAPFALPL